MIYIKDDFLDEELFRHLQNYLTDFKEFDTPNKKFYVMHPPEGLVEHIEDKVSKIEGVKVKSILSFFRQCKENQDNEWRIHNDSIIEGQQPDRAIVIYMNDNKRALNGTAFWQHKTKGDFFQYSDDGQFDEMLKEDSNDKSKWNLKSVIGCKENRLISYPCNYFHSKYPNEFKKERKVFVMFYKTIKQK